MPAQTPAPPKSFPSDSCTSLHELAETQIAKWRAVAHVAAGSSEDGDSAVEEFLGDLIIRVQHSEETYSRSEITTQFLSLIRSKFSTRFSETKQAGIIFLLPRNYDQLEKEMHTFLSDNDIARESFGSTIIRLSKFRDEQSNNAHASTPYRTDWR
nr:hypothetical protein [uncultured Hyphomonas sp.]